MHATQPIPNASAGTGAPSHSLPPSKASIAPVDKPDHSNAPLKPAAKGSEHSGINPDAIPLAGGKKIGEDAYEERKSFSAEGAAAGVGAGGLGGETGANTARNVGTAGGLGSTAGVEKEKERESVDSGAGASTASPSESTSSSGHKKKHSLVEKIKEKVHKH